MLYNLSKSIIESIYGEEDPKLDLYIYGLELLFSSVVSTILLLVFGIIVGALIESIIFIVVFSAIRIFAGGFHSRSFILCNIITVLNFVIILIIYRYFNVILFSPFVYSIVFGLSFILCVLFAPIENNNNPIRDELKTKHKIKALIVLTIDIIVYFVCLYGFKMTQITILLLTLLSVDVFMVIALFIKLRRNKNEKD